jgi:hypothetical protein
VSLDGDGIVETATTQTAVELLCVSVACQGDGLALAFVRDLDVALMYPSYVVSNVGEVLVTL